MPRTPQPLHIFRKDLMHLWPETLVVLALFAAFAWSAPSGWTDSEYVGVVKLLSLFLKVFLMPVSWLVVISRLIHDEPLVGDRQFWTSRPYHWGSLLAAKLLYLAIFLYLPFLLMQVYLLKHAGLYPTTALPALLHNLLLLTVVVVIPIAAISAVTTTFARVLLSIIGAMIYVVVVALVVVYLVLSHMPPPALQPVLIGLLVLLPAIALVYQYATRRTSIARGILIATPLLVAVLLLVTPATALIRHAYPVATTPALAPFPSQFAPKAPQPGNLGISHGKIQVGLPFTVTGADKDSNYLIDGVQVTVDAPGVHWVSPYNTEFGMPFNASTPFRVIPVEMPLTVFNEVGPSLANVHLSVAVQQLKADSPATWKATMQPFSVPGNGICRYSPARPDEPPMCSYPFKLPEVNYVTAPLATECGAGGTPIAGSASLGSATASLDFDPVVTAPLTLKPQGQQAQQQQGYLLCPGTPMTFIEAHHQARLRLEFDEKNLQLANYATHFAPLSERLPQGHPPVPQDLR